jgi:hypothetical protein
MISIIFWLLACVCNAIMDVISTRYDVSIFRNFLNQFFWDWRISWHNKWKNGDILQGEKFLFSSSIFVFLTDAWHLFKALMLLFLILSIYFYVPIFGILDIPFFFISWGITFELLYNIYFIKDE